MTRSNTSRGKFITLEGVEGVGKSTCIEVIKSVLEAAGKSVLITREPGGTHVGERLREVFLDREGTPMTAHAEMLLIFAARVQHVEERIAPALAAGNWVVCDRFTDSTYAYQGAGRYLPEADIAQIEAMTLGQFQPDLTLLLDLDARQGLARATSDADADRLESEQTEFFERVRQAFLQRAKSSGPAGRYRLVDASRTRDEVHRQIKEIIQLFLHQTPEA